MNTVKGFCDLNIPFQCSPTTTLKDVFSRAVKLGYSTIAINTIVGEDVLAPVKKIKGKNKIEQTAADGKKDIPLPPDLQVLHKEISEFMSSGNHQQLRVLNRLTVVLSNPAHAQKLVQSTNTKGYDLIAVCPTTLAAFQYAIASMDVDIISLISNESKEVHFNRRQYVQATDRGMYFEIPYSLMLRDTNSRRKIIQLAHSYHSVGKSKNIIVSSGATSPQELRGPYDVANLGLLLGLTEGGAKSALSLNCRSVALHAAARKTGKCVSSVCETSLLPTQDKWSVHEIHSRLERKLDDDNEPQRKKLRTQSES